MHPNVSDIIEMMSGNRWTRRALIFAVWTCIGLFFSTQVYLMINVEEGKSFSFLKSIRSTVPDWYVWAILTIFIVRLCRRYPFESGTWKSSLLVHFIASIVFSLIHLAIAVTMLIVFERIAGNKLSWTDRFRFNSFWYFHWDVLTYWAIVAFNQAVYYYQSFQERKMTALQLEAQLAQAQLQALKMQLHPHFLFNTLNSISVLMNKDVQAAKKMLVRLGDFLRLTLSSSGNEQVPLRQELEFLRTYLEIEKVRFQDRLTVRMEIDPETMDIPVPNLILQPIVENAIRHGIAPRSSPGCIEIRAGHKNGILILSVEDNGPGISPDHPEGIGLNNVRARLRQHYGEASRLELRDRSGGGVDVRLVMPICTAGVSSAAAETAALPTNGDPSFE